ncbi:unnamed protein product, partial [Trichogramma brassicae]
VDPDVYGRTCSQRTYVTDAVRTGVCIGKRMPSRTLLQSTSVICGPGLKVSKDRFLVPFSLCSNAAGNMPMGPSGSQAYCLKTTWVPDPLNQLTTKAVFDPVGSPSELVRRLDNQSPTASPTSANQVQGQLSMASPTTSSRARPPTIKLQPESPALLIYNFSGGRQSPRRGLTKLAIDGAQHSHDEVRSENHTPKRAPDAGAKAQLERIMAPEARTTLTR